MCKVGALACAAAAAILLTACDDSPNSADQAEAKAQADANAAMVPANAAAAAANSSTHAGTASNRSAWVYDSSADAMQAKPTKTACVTSSNELNLGFPYQDTNQAELCLRQSPRYGLGAYVKLDGDGQILCDDFEGCSIPIKFNDGKIEHFPGASAADNSTNIIFIKRTPALIAALKNASATTIELRFYQNGDQVLTFDTSSLQWPVPD